jgi:uncharacterized protein YbaP (TraB family)
MKNQERKLGEKVTAPNKKTIMIKKYVLLPVVTALMLISLVQCHTGKSAISGDQRKDDKGLLWRISGNELSYPSYLFGTIHMIPSGDYFLPEGTLQAFDTAQMLFLEIDMSELEDPVKQLELMQQSFMKGDTTLKDLVTEEDYALIRDHFAEMGIPVFFLERIKPMFLSVFADGSISPNSLNDGSIKVYEMEFADMAERYGIPVGGLETLDFQMGIMDAIPYQEQADMLVESIKMENVAGSQYDSLVQLYVSQDIAAMYSSFDQDDLSVYDSLLLIDRNHSWIPLMVEQMKTRSCFFAVGAAHLGGPDGVIALLRKEGYRVVTVY